MFYVLMCTHRDGHITEHAFPVEGDAIAWVNETRESTIANVDTPHANDVIDIVPRMSMFTLN